MKVTVLAGAMLLATAGAASADITFQRADTSGVWNLDGTQAASSGGLRSPQGTTYNVYTGLANASNGLLLIESSSAPARDDVVVYDGTSEQINDYIPNGNAGGLNRFVNEFKSPGANPGDFNLNIVITGSGGTAAMPDLFPSGFTSGGQAVTRGAFGFGIGLPASLGGADPLDWNGTNNVLSASVTFTSTTQGLLGPFDITALFTNPWNGVVGIVFSGATGLGITEINVSMVVNKVPAPGAAALLGLGGLVAARRRRN